MWHSEFVQTIVFETAYLRNFICKISVALNNLDGSYEFFKFSSASFLLFLAKVAITLENVYTILITEIRVSHHVSKFFSEGEGSYLYTNTTMNRSSLLEYGRSSSKF